MNNPLKNRTKTAGLYAASAVNLLIMHYYILLTCRLENYTDALLWMDNLLGVVVDVTCILAVALLLTWGRLRPSLLITAIMTMLWAYSNVLYSRFFHHYIPLSAMSQTGVLIDGFMLSNIYEGMKWYDLIIVLQSAMIGWLFAGAKKEDGFRKRHLLLTWPVLLMVADLGLHVLFCAVTPGMASPSYFKRRIITRHFGLLHSSAEPNWSTFHRGTVRQLLIPALHDAFLKTELTAEQRAAIKAEYSNHEERVSGARPKVTDKNIIFIIVESYLSATSDLKVDGQEVTPFLNALKQDSNVYFNPHLTPNISIGESSDGQFLYMAGMLPLRSEVTVTKAKHAELPGLPKILKKEGIISEAQMIIPTLPSMWEQEAMCQRYGFDHLYSSADYEGGKYWYLSDRQIFEYALKEHAAAAAPFLSVILTMTMHQPYNEPMDTTFIITEPSLKEKYRNYLSTSHYTDRQIKWYFEQLKQQGLYDNSIIVIVADHHAHASLFDMADDDISTDIPLYIVNAPIDRNKAWQGRCQQLDVYTTLLDLLGCQSAWKGLGHTLLTTDYHDSLRPELWTLSEQIVTGNYFKTPEP